MRLRCYKIYLWVFLGCFLFPGFGFTGEVHDSFEEVVLAPNKELEMNPESIFRIVCKNQLEAHETYNANFRKGKNLPEILATLLQFKSECQRFVKDLIEQKLLRSPRTCFPTYPWELKDVRTIDSFQTRCFDTDKFDERIQAINTHIEKVLKDRENNASLWRFVLSLSLCSKQQEWRHLLIQKSTFEKARRRYPFMYSQYSASFISLQNTIGEQRYSLQKVKRAIAQNDISPISCKHPEIKHLMDCDTGEKSRGKGHENSLCFLWWIAIDEY